MLAPRRGLCAFSSAVIRRISSYGASARYAAAAQNAAAVEEAGAIEEEAAAAAAPIEEAKPKKKRAPRKKAEKVEEEPPQSEEKKSPSKNEEKKKIEGEKKKKPNEAVKSDDAAPAKKSGGDSAPILKTLKSLKSVIFRSRGDVEVLKKKLAEYEGPFSVAALERAMAGSTAEFALPLFRWATTRPEFCCEAKAVHRFITVLRNGEKLEEARAFIANELSDLPEVQRMAYSATYMGYINVKNDEKADEVLAEMTERGFSPHGSALNRLLLMRWDKDGVDGMLELHREHTARGWLLDAGGYNQMISGLCRAEKMDEAVAEVMESLDKGVVHYEGTFQVLIHALHCKDRLDDALKVADRMFSVLDVKTRCGPLKSFVHKLVENKRYDDAMRIFEHLIRATEPTDLKIVSMLCAAGELDRAVEAAELMRKHQVKYNLEFKVLVAKLCEAKRVEDARKVFDIMVEAGVSPDAQTCTNLAMISGKATSKAVEKEEVEVEKEEEKAIDESFDENDESESESSKG